MNITVGKSRVVTPIPIDQNGNPNPVDAAGNPIVPVSGTGAWSLGELVTKAVTHGGSAELTGFTLTPSADTLTCNVRADTAGVTLALHFWADRGDGIMVHGASIIEAVGEQGPTPVIAGFTLQFGPEQ